MSPGFTPIYVPTTWDESSMDRNEVMDNPSTYTRWLIDIAKTLGYIEHVPSTVNNEYKLLTTDGVDLYWYNINDFPVAGSLTGQEKILIDQFGDKKVSLNDIRSFIGSGSGNNGTNGTNGSSISNFISKEIPAGLHNGINTLFILSFTPIIGTEHVYINGQLQNEGDDYIIINDQIIFDIAPEIISNIRVSYFK